MATPTARVTTARELNADRWSAKDDDWRGYRHEGDKIVFDERGQRVLGLVLPRSGGRLVDIGCGTGIVGRAIAEAAGVVRIEGVDGVPMTDAFPVAVQDLDSTARLPFDDASFDVVVCLETIEHVHDTNHLVRELRRVMKPGGYGIVSVPRLDGFLSIAMLAAGFQPPALECSLRKRYGSPQPDGRVSGHVSNFTKRAFRELLEDEGFRITGFAQVGIYSSWQFAHGDNASGAVKWILWAFSRVPWKQDDMIFRVERAS